MSVEVKQQKDLPLGKCVELVFSGLRYRLFRAAITVTIIALAVAFLMVMLSENRIARQVAGAIDAQTAPRKLFDQWVSRLSTPLSETDLTAALTDLRGPADPRWLEFRAWGRLDDARLGRLRQVAASQTKYMAEFFDRLSEGRRRQLVGSQTGPAIFAFLAQGGNFQPFCDKLPNSDRKLPGTIEEFATFLREFAATGADRQAILAGHRAALDGVKPVLGERTAVEALAGTDGALLDSMRKNGYQAPADEMQPVRDQAQLSLDGAAILKTLNVEIVKRRLADRMHSSDLTKADSAALLSEVASAGGAAWLSELTASSEFKQAAVAQNIAPLTLRASRISQVAANHLKGQELAQIETSIRQSTGGGSAFSGRALWLIIVSFLVCVVGIANAMLMSVTERFREIATMKCLGATDSFIMINFILESILQGLAGGIAGALLGFVLGTLRAWVSYGAMTWQNFPLTGVLAVAGLSLVVGMIVSALAAVYPAYVAARLAPMEAMRIE